jgi:hypothetical protein
VALVTTESGNWNRHAIPEIGLSFDVNRDWPLDSLDLPGGRIVSQRLPGEAGSFFVRYGPAQTLAATVSALGGTVTTEVDEPVALAGRPARRLVVKITTRGGGSFVDDAPARDRAPLVVTQLVLVGLTVGGTPVIAGYRLAAEARATSEPVLERMLGSVERA